MRQAIEQSEREIQGIESRVEQVENVLQEIGHLLQRIAEAVSRLERRGDKETSEALQPNLKEKQEREEEARQELSQLSAELDDLQNRLAEVQAQNDQSRTEIEALKGIGEDVGSALDEVRERDVLLRFQEQKIRALRERLGGFVPAETSLYEPRSVSPISERVRWVDDGIQPVAVSELPSPEGIESAADFKKVSMEQTQAGILRLQEMLPAIESGAGASSEFWATYDQEHGLEYANGYQRVYEAFFGLDAIKVTHDGESYDIINGRHRVWLAQKMGIEHLPMRVTRKVEIQDT